MITSITQSITSSHRCDDFYSPRQHQAKATGGLSKYRAFDLLKACKCGHALRVILDGDLWVWSCSACGRRKHSTGGRVIARRGAHEAFDPLWQQSLPLYGLNASDDSREARKILAVARKRAYRWLVQKLGRELDHKHLGMCSSSTCREIVLACEGMNAAGIRAWAKVSHESIASLHRNELSPPAADESHWRASAADLERGPQRLQGSART